MVEAVKEKKLAKHWTAAEIIPKEDVFCTNGTHN